MILLLLWISLSKSKSFFFDYNYFLVKLVSTTKEIMDIKERNLSVLEEHLW